jgi:hypothetical protein
MFFAARVNVATEFTDFFRRGLPGFRGRVADLWLSGIALRIFIFLRESEIS